ncbi:MAG TPA: hypothetical protein VKV20_08080 [Ktedonobacteraceae bacterium]|jgi:outer membrane lipoprotein-sorting protein|nr:hypothetical protein [Ktedonobacteraceae bacterium]
MHKVRSILATIVLAVTLLSGLSFQGPGSIANAAASHSAGSAGYALVAAMSSESGAKPNGPCPSGTTTDC